MRPSAAILMMVGVGAGMLALQKRLSSTPSRVSPYEPERSVPVQKPKSPKETFAEREERLIGLMLPTMQRKTRQLLAAMRADGYDPFVGNTARTPEQAAANEASGLGIADSMHIHGIALDIASVEHMWSSEEFYAGLNRHAVALGLTTGFLWKDKVDPVTGKVIKRVRDPGHVQGIPLAKQTAFRRLTSPEAKEAYLAQYFRSIEARV